MALPGTLMYNKPPTIKKIKNVALRPKKSDRLAQKNRPPILNKLNKAVKLKDKNKIEKLLALANDKRARLMKYKVSKKEIQ